VKGKARYHAHIFKSSPCSSPSLSHDPNPVFRLYYSDGGLFKITPRKAPTEKCRSVCHHGRSSERTCGQVKAAEAIQKELLIKYQQTIQTAFQEVEDNLIDQRKSREKMEAQGEQVKSLRTYRDLANLRYENGYSRYLEVLDAEKNFYSMEINYIQTKWDIFNAKFNLYKAMGGWEIEDQAILQGQGMWVGWIPRKYRSGY